MVLPTEVHGLIDQGFWPFPLRPRSKHPLGMCDRCGADKAPCRLADSVCPCWAQRGICHGHRAATNDHDTADAWMSQWPAANWGLATEPSGLVVVDPDAKGAQRPATVLPDHLGLGQPVVANGVELFSHVARALSGTDRLATRVVRTPSGGFHAYFRPADG